MNHELPKIGVYSCQPISFYQEKLDGYSVKLSMSGGKVSVLQRGGTEIHDKLKFMECMQAVYNIPDGTVLFGELHVPGIQATSIPTLINSRDERLQLTVFAAGQIGLWSPFNCEWESVETKLNCYGFRTPITVKHSSVNDPRPFLDVQVLLRQARERKLEGYVLKANCLDGWYKLKPIRTVDAFVIRSEESQAPTTFGGLKSVDIGVYDKNGHEIEIATVGTGFDMDFRLSVDQRTLRGRVCEVSYDSLAGKGRLKFPRFIRWREDKKPKECRFDQLL